MKRILQSLITIVLLCFSISAFAQQTIQYTLKYNTVSSEYEVYMKSNVNGPNNLLGSCGVTVVMPTSIPDNPINPINLAGGAWGDNSTIYADPSEPTHDYHNFSTSGSNSTANTYVANTEKLLFKFSLPGGCVAGIRLYENTTDINGMGGGDWVNYCELGTVPLSDKYISNYNNTGISCAPATAPDLITTIGQPSPSLVAGTPSSVPVTVTNIGTAPTTGVITTTITLPTGTSAPAGPFVTNGNTCTTSGQTVTCTNPGPLTTTAPSNSTVMNIPVTAAPSTVGTNPGPFAATPSTPGETTTANNPATPMTPTDPVSPAPAPDLITTIGQPLPSLVAGQPSTVPVTVTNIGTAPTTGVITTTITLPTGTSASPTFTSNGNTCTTSGQTVTCTNPGPLSTTSPTNSTLIEVPVTAAPSIVGTNPGPFTATPSTPGETVTANNPAAPMTPTMPVVAAPAPDLVTVIGQPSPALVAGQPSTVPVTVTNIGNAPTTGVITTSITLPTGTSASPTFTSNGNTCTTSGQTVTCTNPGPLSVTSPTNSTLIEVPVTAAPSTVGTKPGPFTATPSTPGETTTANNPATPMTPTNPVSPAPAPDLITTIGQPSPSLVAGQPSTVPVTVTNIGTAPTTGVITTTITLPTGTSASPAFTSNGNTCTTSGQTVTCTNPGPLSVTSPTNSTLIEVPVTAAPSTVGTKPGPFAATPSTPGETTTANNPATPMTPTNPVTAAFAPDLVTTIGAASPAMVVGQTSTLPVTITNIGTAPTTGTVTTTITLPAGVSTQPLFVTNGYTCSTSGQTVTCFSNTPLSNVVPNNAALLQIPITPAASTVNTTPVFNANTSGGGEPAGNTTNNAAPPTTSGTVSPVPAPNVTIALGQPSPNFVAGSPSNVPVTISNIGTAPETGNINATITLPTGFSAPATFAPAVGTTCTTTGQVVSCITAGPLSNTAGSNVKIFNIPVTPAASTVGTTPTTTASVSSPNEPAANQGDNTATPMTPTTPVSAAPAPDLVTVIGQPSPGLVAGQPSTVPVTVTNIGTAPTTGTITTTITLPTGTSAPATFTSNGNTCTTSGQVVTCTNPGPLSTTSPTNSTVINVPVTAAPSTVGTNPGPFAATPSTPGETTTGNNTAPLMTPTNPVSAAPAPNVTIALSQPTPNFMVGQPSNVLVTISNIGSATETGNINTTIYLPTGFSTPATFSPAVGTTCTTAGQVVSCITSGPLNYLTGSNTKLFNVPITPAASTAGTSPQTTASISSPNEPASNQGNNTASMAPTTPVAAAPVADLVTTIGQPSPALVAGTPSTVPVTVTNIGTAPTTGVITTVITLPIGTSTLPTFTSNGNTCTTSGQTVTCTNPSPLSNLAPNNSTVINVPVTAAPSTVGTNPGPFAATPSTPGETVTANNPAAPMTPTNPVVAAPIVSVKLNVKVFLQGAYDAGTGLMRDDLRTKGFLPLSQPYSAMARTSYHIGTEVTTAAALAATGSNAIVDWVLLELRTGTTAATRVATRAALVQRDGDVVDVDGVSSVTFNNRAAGSYYVVATHRNHLGAMSEVAVALSANPTTCDFTGAYDGFGSNAQKAIGNLNALWAGNSNHTGITHRNTIFSGANNDPDAVKNNVLTTVGNSALDFSYVPMGYHIGDTNLDGDVKYQGPTNDVDNLIFFNVLSHPANTTFSPLFLITEQH